MLHILLTILKVIGIILLIIVACLLLILLSVLFVPIKYKGKVNINEERKVKGKISWLFSIVAVTITYEKQFKIVLKIFGIPFLLYTNIENIKKTKKKQSKLDRKRKKRERKQQRNEAKQKRRESKRKNNEAVELVDEHNSIKNEQVDLQEHTILKNEYDNDKTETSYVIFEPKLNKTEDDSKHKKKPKFPFFHKLHALLKKIGYFIVTICKKIKNIKFTIRKICAKIKNIKETIEYYTIVLQKQQSKDAMNLCKKQLLLLLKHVKPKKLKGNITFGTGDPYTTGQILGVICMFYPVYGNHIYLTADFEQRIFEIDLLLKGRIRIFTLLKICWKVMFDKNVKKLITLLKREA